MTLIHWDPTGLDPLSTEILYCVIYGMLTWRLKGNPFRAGEIPRFNKNEKQNDLLTIYPSYPFSEQSDAGIVNWYHYGLL